MLTLDGNLFLLPFVEPAYSPFRDASATYFSGPHVGTIKRFERALRKANHDNNFVLNGYRAECVSVIRVFLEELSPTLFHDILAISRLALVICYDYERVVISH